MAKITLKDIHELIQQGKHDRAKKILGSFSPEKVPFRAKSKIAILYALLKDEEQCTLWSQAAEASITSDVERAFVAQEAKKIEEILPKTPQLKPGTLQSSLLFSTLSDEEVERVTSSGKVRRYDPADRATLVEKDLGYINILVEGKLRASYSDPSGQISTKDLTEGAMFGPIGVTIGIGKFVHVELIEICAIWTVSLEAFRDLYETSETFQRHYSSLRLSLQKPQTVAAPTQAASRLNRRIDVEPLGLMFKPAGGAALRVKDVSISGIFVLGHSTLTEGSTVLGILEDPHELHSLSLSGKVARVTDAGAGIQLQFGETKGDFERWKDWIQKLSTSDLAERLKETIVALQDPLSAHFLEDGKYHGAQLTGMSSSKAVLETAEEFHSGKSTKLRVLVPSAQGKKETIEMPVRIDEQTSKGYIVIFGSLTPVQREKLARAVALDGKADVKNLEATKQPQDTILHTLTLSSVEAFSDLYANELVSGVLTVNADGKAVSGSPMNITIKVNSGLRAIPTGYGNFHIKGKVIRVAKDGKSIVRLSETPLHVSNRMKKLVQMAGESALNTSADIKGLTEATRKAIMIGVTVVTIPLAIWLLSQWYQHVLIKKKAPRPTHVIEQEAAKDLFITGN